MIGVGRTIANYRHNNGTNCAIFNDSYPSLGNARFYDENGKVKYQMTVSSGTSNRCGVFINSTAYQPTSKRLVLFQDSDDNSIVKPIFEMISPSITIRNTSETIISWWSNISDFSAFEANCHVMDADANYYKYNSAYLKKFSEEEIDSGELEVSEGNSRILCQGHIYFEKLMQKESLTIDTNPVIYPVVRSVFVASVFQNQGYIVDFSTAGSGGGSRIHNHTSNEECGFAAGIFMPSAFIRPFNWK